MTGKIPSKVPKARAPKKRFRLQKIRRRDLILLSGALTLACYSLFVVTVLILRNQPTAGSAAIATVTGGTPVPQPTHTVTFVQITGLNQFPLAQQAARAWSNDAQLVSASASWQQVLDLDRVGEPALWAYRFYSPTRQRLFFVYVEADGQVQTIEHVVPVTLPPRPVPAGSWVIDSPAALAIWLDYGGNAMLLTNPGLEILVQLRVANNTQQPVWVVIGLDNRTEDLRRVVIDANAGTVISASSTN